MFNSYLNTSKITSYLTFVPSKALTIKFANADADILNNLIARQILAGDGNTCIQNRHHMLLFTYCVANEEELQATELPLKLSSLNCGIIQSSNFSKQW